MTAYEIRKLGLTEQVGSVTIKYDKALKRYILNGNNRETGEPLSEVIETLTEARRTAKQLGG